jgi:uncharacterized protein (DUF4415 family)
MTKTYFDSEEMRDEYDFSHARRGSILSYPKRTRITIAIEDDLLEFFKQFANEQQQGYEALVNQALREYLGRRSITLDEDTLRRVIREELQAVA